MKSRFIIEFGVDIEKLMWDGDDITKEVEHEVHLAFDRWLHSVFESPDGMMDDLVDGLNHHIDESCLPDKFELPSFSLSLKDDKQVESEIKKDRDEELKRVLTILQKHATSAEKRGEEVDRYIFSEIEDIMSEVKEDEKL